MAKFAFRLEKLLEYRRMQEGWAKDAYLAARARRIEGEQEIEELQGRRTEALQASPSTVQAMLDLEAYLVRLDDLERDMEVALSVLKDEEETARQEWIRARTDAEALQKLRDNEFADWLREENRREQAELDEWAVTRRAA